MPNVVMFADTVRSPELRHEVPLQVPDPLIYVERNGSRLVFARSLELPRLAELGGLEPAGYEALGMDELIKEGLVWHEMERELVVRACRQAGVDEAAVPRTFPLDVADHLRANGIEVRADGGLFDGRRRSKTSAEIDGIRKAQRACEAAMTRVRELLAGGPGVTCEELHAEINRVFTEQGVAAPNGLIASHGPQTAVGHEPGHGRIEAGEPVVVDLYPQDPASGCYADMTRTFCIEEPPDELREYHRLAQEALARVIPAVRPGASGADLYALAAEVYEEAGYPTQRTKAEGQVLEEGFFHSLGHGVGLEVHELPLLGRNGQELVAGDVVTLEPGCYRPGFGGARLEDLALVTDDGCELLTSFPYDLEVSSRAKSGSASRSHDDFAR